MTDIGKIILINKNGRDGSFLPLPRNSNQDIIIGRCATADIRIQNDQIADEHCSISFNGYKAVIRNLTKAATFVNDVSLAKQGQRSFLQHKDLIKIEDRTFRWEYVQDLAFSGQLPYKGRLSEPPTSKSTPLLVSPVFKRRSLVYKKPLANTTTPVTKSKKPNASLRKINKTPGFNTSHLTAAKLKNPNIMRIMRQGLPATPGSSGAVNIVSGILSPKSPGPKPASPGPSTNVANGKCATEPRRQNVAKPKSPQGSKSAGKHPQGSSISRAKRFKSKTPESPKLSRAKRKLNLNGNSGDLTMSAISNDSASEPASDPAEFFSFSNADSESSLYEDSVFDPETPSSSPVPSRRLFHSTALNNSSPGRNSRGRNSSTPKNRKQSVSIRSVNRSLGAKSASKVSTGKRSRLSRSPSFESTLNFWENLSENDSTMRSQLKGSISVAETSSPLPEVQSPGRAGLVSRSQISTTPNAGKTSKNSSAISKPNSSVRKSSMPAKQSESPSRADASNSNSFYSPQALANGSLIHHNSAIFTPYTCDLSPQSRSGSRNTTPTGKVLNAARSPDSPIVVYTMVTAGQIEEALKSPNNETLEETFSEQTANVASLSKSQSLRSSKATVASPKDSTSKTPVRGKKSPRSGSNSSTPLSSSPGKRSRNSTPKTPPSASAKQAAPVSSKKTPAKTPSKATPNKVVAPSSAKKSSAKQTPTKRTPQSASKKTPVSSALSSAKKTPAKQTPAKKTPAQQTPAKKSPAKQIPAKKTPAKQTPAKRTSAMQIPAKKTPAKQTPAKKTPAMQTPAKKTPQSTSKKTPVSSAQSTPSSGKKSTRQSASVKKATQSAAKKTPQKSTPNSKKGTPKRPSLTVTPGKSAKKTTPKRNSAKKSGRNETSSFSLESESSLVVYNLVTPDHLEEAEAMCHEADEILSVQQKASDISTPNERSTTSRKSAKKEVSGLANTTTTVSPRKSAKKSGKKETSFSSEPESSLVVYNLVTPDHFEEAEAICHEADEILSLRQKGTEIATPPERATTSRKSAKKEVSGLVNTTLSVSLRKSAKKSGKKEAPTFSSESESSLVVYNLVTPDHLEEAEAMCHEADEILSSQQKTNPTFSAPRKSTSPLVVYNLVTGDYAEVSPAKTPSEVTQLKSQVTPQFTRKGRSLAQSLSSPGEDLAVLNATRKSSSPLVVINFATPNQLGTTAGKNTPSPKLSTSKLTPGKINTTTSTGSLRKSSLANVTPKGTPAKSPSTASGSSSKKTPTPITLKAIRGSAKKSTKKATPKSVVKAAGAVAAVKKSLRFSALPSSRTPFTKAEDSVVLLDATKQSSRKRKLAETIDLALEITEFPSPDDLSRRPSSGRLGKSSMFNSPNMMFRRSGVLSPRLSTPHPAKTTRVSFDPKLGGKGTPGNSRKSNRSSSLKTVAEASRHSFGSSDSSLNYSDVSNLGRKRKGFTSTPMPARAIHSILKVPSRESLDNSATSNFNSNVEMSTTFGDFDSPQITQDVFVSPLSVGSDRSRSKSTYSAANKSSEDELQDSLVHSTCTSPNMSRQEIYEQNTLSPQESIGGKTSRSSRRGVRTAPSSPNVSRNSRRSVSSESPRQNVSQNKSIPSRQSVHLKQYTNFLLARSPNQGYEHNLSGVENLFVDAVSPKKIPAQSPTVTTTVQVEKPKSNSVEEKSPAATRQTRRGAKEQIVPKKQATPKKTKNTRATIKTPASSPKATANSPKKRQTRKKILELTSPVVLPAKRRKQVSLSVEATASNVKKPLTVEPADSVPKKSTRATKLTTVNSPKSITPKTRRGRPAKAEELMPPPAPRAVALTVHVSSPGATVSVRASKRKTHPSEASTSTKKAKQSPAIVTPVKTSRGRSQAKSSSSAENTPAKKVKSQPAALNKKAKQSPAPVTPVNTRRGRSRAKSSSSARSTPAKKPKKSQPAASNKKATAKVTETKPTALVKSKKSVAQTAEMVSPSTVRGRATKRKVQASPPPVTSAKRARKAARLATPVEKAPTPVVRKATRAKVVDPQPSTSGTKTPKKQTRARRTMIPSPMSPESPPPITARGRNAKAAAPKAKAAAPKAKAATPKAKAATSKAKAAAPKAQAATSKAKAAAPKVHAATSKVQAATPKAKAVTSKAHAATSKAQAATPKAKAAAPKAIAASKAKAGKSQAKTANPDSPSSVVSGRITRTAGTRGGANKSKSTAKRPSLVVKKVSPPANTSRPKRGKK